LHPKGIKGWERKSDVPDEWTFLRIFADFSTSRLPECVQKSGPKNDCREIPDSTGGQVRRSAREAANSDKKQSAGLSLDAILTDPPPSCDVGTKKQQGAGYL